MDKYLKWERLPDRYLDPEGRKTPHSPSGIEELLEDGFKWLGWGFGKLGKVVLWLAAGVVAVVLFVLSPLWFLGAVLLCWLVWGIWRED